MGQFTGQQLRDGLTLKLPQRYSSQVLSIRPL
jgi:hypothetical protein